MARPFVKARGTDVPVGRSQAELERVLRRYGATGFGVQQDYLGGIVKVFFRVPDRPGAPTTIPVRLDIDVNEVYNALHRARPPKAEQRGEKWGQAERVAWRQLILWVDAALSAASAGMQPISEAFFAHTLVRADSGKVERMVDHLNQAVPGGNWRALLPPGDGTASG